MTESNESKNQFASVLKLVFFLIVAGSSLVIAGAGGVLWYFSRQLPKLISVEDYKPPVVTQVYTSGDNPPVLIGEFYGKERRYLVPYEKIPKIVVQAFISAEDDQFFEHSGINVVSIIRAGIANFRAGHVVQGGSTITQQVAKSLLLTPEKSLLRKIKEVILSSRIEQNLTKQQILYLYLNQIYLGHGAYGVQAASRSYYQKDVSELTIAEAAILAGLPQAPSKYSPILNSQKAKDRQRYVLRRMAANGFITEAQLNEALGQPIKIYHDDDINLKYAPYLIEHVRRYLVEKYGEDSLYEGGMTVLLPTSVQLLKAARSSIIRGLDEVDKRIGFRGPVQQLATNEDIEKFLRDERAKLIVQKLGYEFLMPDGRLDLVEAMRGAGIQSESALLETNRKYEAVVTSIDDTKKVAGVMIGAIKAEIPMDKMLWARLARDEKNPQALRPEPKLPSKVLKKGDVVWVNLVEVSPKGVIVGLDQQSQVQGALFSIDVKTGAVLAMEGGYDFTQSEFNRAIQASRQPGSSFKPIIYSAALEKGYTPASIIVDSPIVYNDGDSGKWKPSNFEEKFYGDTTFRQALIKSRNVPTIKIVQALQVPFVIDYAKRLGITGQFNADLSISLGSGSVDLVDLTKAYALFPRLGRKVNPTFISSVKDRAGQVLEEKSLEVSILPTKIPTVMAEVPSPVSSGTPEVSFPQYPLADDPDQVLDPRVSYVMTHLMKEVITYGTGHAAQGLGKPAAGKTGTTNDYLDAWFMGFTRHVVTGVWVGFDNHRSMGPGETGAKAALPIWLEYMREAVKNYPSEDFQVPSGVVFASINPVTGKLATPNSSSAIQEVFIEGTQPVEMSDKKSLSSDSQAEFFKEDLE